ncbi:MAG TPA: glycosyltransferase family 1 protein [Candidatus Saccharimonadales bacterium]|nr:glycosyltransferase family 1 protein [Candidatus Saccharimonadales bacterium]
MSHILIDARELRTSSGRYVERLLHYLQQVSSGHEYTVLVKPEDFDGWQPTNPQFTKVACPFKEFTFSEQTGMYRQITNIAPDLVHFPFAQQPVFYRGTSVTTVQDLTAIRFGNPTKNWLAFTFKQQVYRWVIKRVARKSKALITPTEFVKKDVAAYAHVPASKITVTLESADPIPDSPTPLKNIQGHNLQKSKFIMYLGRPQPHKNLWRLLEAHALLRRRYPGLLLILAGKKDAMYDLIEARARREGLLDGVVFTGFVSEAELRWLYNHTAAYVFPSLSEGFGLPPLEAMHCDAPVVASNASCIPEVLGDAAHYFNALDIGDIAQKVGEVIGDPALRAQLVARGKKQVAKYSWRRMAEQTLAVYNRVLEEK